MFFANQEFVIGGERNLAALVYQANVGYLALYQPKITFVQLWQKGMGRICALAANSYGVFPSSAFRRCMVLMDVSNRMLVSEVAFRLQSTVLAEADNLPRHLGSRSIHCAKVRVSERRLVGRPNPCILARVF